MTRLSKRNRWLVGMAIVLLLMAVTIPLAIWVTHTQTAQLENTRRRCDDISGSTHHVVIRDNTVTPHSTTALQCDTLVITNMDNRIRLIAFGPHDNHISYDGVSEKVLSKGQSLTIKLGSVGTYPFHDHEEESVNGSFSVSRPED